jgi:hypothetical protein
MCVCEIRREDQSVRVIMIPAVQDTAIGAQSIPSTLFETKLYRVVEVFGSQISATIVAEAPHVRQVVPRPGGEL